jgi:hypothetical protein
MLVPPVYLSAPMIVNVRINDSGCVL